MRVLAPAAPFPASFLSRLDLLFLFHQGKRKKEKGKEKETKARPGRKGRRENKENKTARQPALLPGQLNTWEGQDTKGKKEKTIFCKGSANHLLCLLLLALPQKDPKGLGTNLRSARYPVLTRCRPEITLRPGFGSGDRSPHRAGCQTYDLTAIYRVCWDF